MQYNFDHITNQINQLQQHVVARMQYGEFDRHLYRIDGLYYDIGDRELVLCLTPLDANQSKADRVRLIANLSSVYSYEEIRDAYTAAVKMYEENSAILDSVFAMEGRRLINNINVLADLLLSYEDRGLVKRAGEHV